FACLLLYRRLDRRNSARRHSRGDAVASAKLRRELCPRIHPHQHHRRHTAPTESTATTPTAGIHFTHFKGNDGVSINLEEFGPGVCVSDYDKDGWQDIYFVNGRDRYNR